MGGGGGEASSQDERRLRPRQRASQPRGDREEERQQPEGAELSQRTHDGQRPPLTKPVVAYDPDVENSSKDQWPVAEARASVQRCP